MVTVLKASITTSIIVTFILHSFFNSRYLTFFSIRLVSIVPGGCNQSSLLVFYVVLESLYRYVNVICLQCWQVLFLPPFLIHVVCQHYLWDLISLCMVISFLILWSICLSSSRVYFKNSPEYLTRDTAQVFIPLIRFLLCSFVSINILVLQRYSFLFFSSPLVWWYQLPRCQSICTFLVFVPNSIPMSWLYILPCKLEFLVPFHFCKQFDVVHVH